MCARTAIEVADPSSPRSASTPSRWACPPAGLDDRRSSWARPCSAASAAPSCHLPSLTTGACKGVPEVSNQMIQPFTDLLLHDMGPALADGRPDFKANGSEWRTPPLWGIGLVQTVNGHSRFLHDGRARGR